MSPRLSSFLAWRRSSIFGLVILPVILVAAATAVIERRLTDYRLKETVQVESLHDIDLTLRNLTIAIESSDSLAAAQRYVAAAARQKGLHAAVLADVESLTILASSKLEDLGRDLSLSIDRAAAEALQDFARTRAVAFHRDDKAVGGVYPVRLPWKKADRRGLAAEGAIYLRTDDVDRLLSGSLHLGYWLDVVSAARLVLVYGLAVWLVRRHVLRPTRDMKVGLRAIAAGRAETRLPDLGAGELGQVAKVLNETLDQLARADKQVLAMATVAPVGLFWVNSREECLGVNPAWSQLTGVSEAEALGLAWLQSIYPPDRERFTRDWNGPETSGPNAPQTYRLQHRDGSLRWVLGSRLPLLDGEGRLTGYIGSLTDITALRALEDQLRRSEEKHRTLFETLNQGVFVFNAAGQITDANPAAQEMCGLGRAELWDGALATAPHWRPFDENRLPIPFGRWSVKESPSTEKAVRNRTLGVVDHRSGLTRWFQVDVIGVRSAEHAPVGTTFVTFHEITAVREAELALRHSETLYANLVETSHDLIFQCDARGRFIFLNSAWERTLGYPTTEMLGRLPTDFCDPSVSPADIVLFADVVSGHPATTGELLLRSKSGDRVELLVKITRLGRGDEALQGMLGTAYDVTEQKKAERALKSADQLFTSFFFNAREAMVIGSVDEETIVEANEAANRLFGFSGRELIGRDRSILLDATDPRLGPAMKVREETGSFIGELRCVRTSGETFDAEVTSIIYTGRNGRPHSGTIIRDLSGQKELLAVQLRSQRLESIGTLTGGIAHDFNNALGPLLLGFDLLKKQFPEREGLVSNMRASTARAAATVRQLMSFARGSDGTHVPVATAAMFAEIVRIVTSTFPREIRCITSVPADSWPLLGDETQLQQVLLNLCLNARDAMPEGGQLRFEADNLTLVTAVETGRGRGEPGHYVRWNISDSGAGMSAQVLERIFDPFFTTKGPGAGTGLGLAMVLGIVRGHRGFLDVKSAPDEGTTFSLYFPASPLAGPDASAAPTPAPGPQLTHRTTLLLVEDEPIVRDVTAAVLTSLGFQVVTATDGTDALFKLANLSGDVRGMLTDLQMPHMNGQALVRVVMKMIPDLPIIAMSGKFTDQDEADLAALGVRACLQKPFDESRLVAVLRAIFPDGFQPPEPTPPLS
jgi:PAS domain S-box-containing protein